MALSPVGPTVAYGVTLADDFGQRKNVAIVAAPNTPAAMKAPWP
jgi:hypothetical protein